MNNRMLKLPHWNVFRACARYEQTIAHVKHITTLPDELCRKSVYNCAIDNRNHEQFFDTMRAKSPFEIAMSIVFGNGYLWWKRQDHTSFVASDYSINRDYINDRQYEKTELSDFAWYYHQLRMIRERELFPNLYECQRMFDIVNAMYLNYNMGKSLHFHGTKLPYANAIFEKGIDRSYSQDKGDFTVGSKGFYLTSSNVFANDWAINKSVDDENQQDKFEGAATLKYHVEQKLFHELKIKTFGNYKEWSEFVLKGTRYGLFSSDVGLDGDTDVIIGPLFLNNGLIDGTDKLDVGSHPIPFLQQTALTSDRATHLFNNSRRDNVALKNSNERAEYLLDFDKFNLRSDLAPAI